jgi:hypothetical protein
MFINPFLKSDASGACVAKFDVEAVSRILHSNHLSDSNTESAGPFALTGFSGKFTVKCDDVAAKLDEQLLKDSSVNPQRALGEKFCVSLRNVAYLMNLMMTWRQFDRADVDLRLHPQKKELFHNRQFSLLPADERVSVTRGLLAAISSLLGEFKRNPTKMLCHGTLPTDEQVITLAKKFSAN